MTTSNPYELPHLLLSKREAARLLGVSARLVDALLARGELRGVKIGRRRLFTLDELREFVARRGGGA